MSQVPWRNFNQPLDIPRMNGQPMCDRALAVLMRLGAEMLATRDLNADSLRSAAARFGVWCTEAERAGVIKAVLARDKADRRRVGLGR